LFFFSFVLGIRPFDMSTRPIVETILTLPLAGNNQQRERPINPQPMTIAPPRMLSAPIVIPKPPPIHLEEKPEGTQTPGDVLGAVGRELACSAGSWEHLTAAERERCGFINRYPWRGMKLPNGSLVMVPASILPRLKDVPQSEFSVNTGADSLRAQTQAGITPGQGGCPVLQQTPCLHATPGMRDALGDR